MAQQTEQLESLNAQRQFFYLLSLYGCYDKNDLKQKLGRSKGTIDTGILLFKYFIQESKRSMTPSKEKSQTYAIPYSRYAPCDNDLVNLFRQKNFTTNQMNYDFLLLFLLSSAQKPLSVKECMDGFLSISDLSFQEIGDFPTTDGLRESLQELLSLGFVVESGTKGKKLYELTQELTLPPEIWENIHRALDFFRNESLFSSQGYFCQETILEGVAEVSPEQDYPFAFRRYFPHAMLEEDLALCLLEAWEEEVCVRFVYQDMEDQEKKYTVVPLHLIQNVGRQHLFAYDIQEKSLLSLPLWRLSKLEKLDGKKKKQKKQPFSRKEFAQYGNLLEDYWSMTRLHLVENPMTAKAKAVEIDFHPKATQRHIDGVPRLWRRLQEEKRHGTVTKLAPDHYFFSISVTEPREMIPWIRSFGAEAKVRASDDHDLIEVLQRHRKEMAESYGLVSPLS